MLVRGRKGDKNQTLEARMPGRLYTPRSSPHPCYKGAAAKASSFEVNVCKQIAYPAATIEPWAGQILKMVFRNRDIAICILEAKNTDKVDGLRIARRPKYGSINKDK